MKKEIVLSISILISNRPDTVEKCLKSLNSLRNKVSCELILTDTGCGEELREIIEQYADKIFSFEWCNDFAKARNVGLCAAKGEWFLYMDDDEWFEDTKEIEGFFLSGNYKKYGEASYKVRNYKNMQGTEYNETVVPRMVKRTPDVCFQGKIHEGLINIDGNAKILQSYVHHYGYVFVSEEERYKHSQRNLVPLLEEHAKEPYDLHNNVQIAQEYNNIKEYMKSIEISLKGIECYSEERTTPLYLNALCINIVERYVKLFSYEEAISHAKKYLQDNRIVNIGKARIIVPMSVALYQTKRYEECAEYIEQYMFIYRDYLKNAESYQEQSAYMMYGCFTKAEQRNVMSLGTLVNLLLSNYERAVEFFSEINIEDDYEHLDIVLLRQVVGAFLRADDLQDVKRCIAILNTLFEYEMLHPKLIAYFEEERKNNPESFAKQNDKWQYLSGNCWYLDYLKLDIGQNGTESAVDKYRNLWSDVENVLQKSVALGIWEKAESAGVDMGEIIEEIPYYKWRRVVNAALAVMQPEQRAQLHEYIIAKCDESSDKILYWKSGYYLKVLTEVSDRPEKATSKENDNEQQGLIENFAEDLVCFAESSVCLAKRLYQEEVVTNNRDMLPEYIQAAFCMADLLRYEEEADYAKAIRELKMIKDILPSVAVVVKLYTLRIEEQVNASKRQEEAERQAENAEMQQLAEAIKAKIRLFLQEGNKEIAAQLIAQLESIVGSDAELEELKQFSQMP